jgi:hypothetical protein
MMMIDSTIAIIIGTTGGNWLVIDSGFIEAAFD